MFVPAMLGAGLRHAGAMIRAGCGAAGGKADACPEYVPRIDLPKPENLYIPRAEE